MPPYTQSKVLIVPVAPDLASFTKDAIARMISHSVKKLVTKTGTVRAMFP